jgi:recombination associated protein RdgC
MMYRITSAWEQTVAKLEAELDAGRFVACIASQEKSVGWIPPRGEEHGALVEVIGGQWILKFMVEVKILPATVVKRRAEEQIRHIEATTGRKPGKKESRDVREDARLALLPMAFTKQSSVWVWMDPDTRLLVLSAGSQARADEVMTGLIKAIDGLAVQLINTQMSPAAAMGHWLSIKEAPQGFSVDRECELKAADESKAVVRYARHPLDTDEVSQHIAMGKLPTRLALTWNEHVSFVLTEALQLKKVAVLDTVLEAVGSTDQGDEFDGNVAIITGELGQLIPDLLEALGGEVGVT